MEDLHEEAHVRVLLHEELRALVARHDLVVLPIFKVVLQSGRHLQEPLVSAEGGQQPLKLLPFLLSVDQGPEDGVRLVLNVLEGLHQQHSARGLGRGVKLVVLKLGVDVVDGVLALDKPLEVLLHQQHPLVLALVELLGEVQLALLQVLLGAVPVDLPQVRLGVKGVAGGEEGKVLLAWPVPESAQPRRHRHLLVPQGVAPGAAHPSPLVEAPVAHQAQGRTVPNQRGIPKVDRAEAEQVLIRGHLAVREDAPHPLGPHGRLARGRAV
mmetsp:Transcript_6996/g.24073  ORF Transcript_6996/g.24073 Transcript_6996/m.24073 type:complete len:268 (+) Transcript_6996:1875-2678(+)